MTVPDPEPAVKPRRPMPWHPAADLDDSGPQEGWAWSRHDWPDNVIGRLTHAVNPHALRPAVFDRLAGGRPDPGPLGWGHDVRFRVYPTEAAAMADLNAAEGPTP